MTTVEAQNILKKPAKLKSPPKKRNRDKNYLYHKDYDRNTKGCFKLKITIEKLIEKGHLAEFVTNKK